MQAFIVILALVYLVVGGFFPVGQTVAVEIGRYEIWEKQRRLLFISALGVFTFLLVLTSMVVLGLNWILFPIVLFSVMLAEKASVYHMNKYLPERFQPTAEELKAKYGDLFKVDLSDVKAVLEDEFTKKLGFERKISTISFLDEEAEGEADGLKEVIEGFIKKEKRQKMGKRGRE